MSDPRILPVDEPAQSPSPPIQPKKSHLPAWLLESKALSESVRRSSVELNTRLTSLAVNVSDFSSLVENSKKNAATMKAKLLDDLKPPPKPDPIILHHRLNSDTAVLVLTFLPLPHLMRYAATCTLNLEFVSVGRFELWAEYSRRHFLEWWTDPVARFEYDDLGMEDEEEYDTDDADGEEYEQLPPTSTLIDEYAKKSCVAQRRCLMHASLVQFITKTLGRLATSRSRSRYSNTGESLFDRKRDKAVSHPMPLPKRNLEDVGLIMSQVNSVSAEQRKTLLRALQKMSYLTANPRDTVTTTLFVDMGMVTMLTALLANESGAVKELAAMNIANLVVSPPNMDRDYGLLTMYDERVLERRREMRREIAASSLPGALMNLLSSPQARVSLHGVTTSFQQDRIQSMRCQSLANKHASRAMINVLVPELEICVGDREVIEGVTAPEARAVVLPDIDAKRQGSVVKDQPPNTVAVIRRNGVEYVPIDGADESGPADLMKFLGSGFGQHTEKEIFWTCYYFYSSGVQKDEYQMVLKLGLDGSMSGSGEDHLGEFEFEGQGDAAFGDNSFAFSKTYSGRGNNVPRGGHIAHIGHYSCGTVLGELSVGFWGVWELVTSNPHYKLEKGGVFRMIPSYIVEEVGRENIVCWDPRS